MQEKRNKITKINQGQELKDIRNGKEIPWQSKKLANLAYHELLKDLDYKKAENVKLCAEVLEFEKTEQDSLKLKNAWFCKSKLCPICNWRKSMKYSYQMIQILDQAMDREPTSRFLFWTLTTKNVYGSQALNQALRELTRAFNLLIKYKKIKQNLLGFIRATEVTVNSIDGSYNQHLHVLVMVKQTYFKGSENYISQEELTKFWKKALKVDYLPIVHIQVVKAKNKRYKSDNELLGAVYETGKYAVKDSDYLTIDYAENLRRVDDLEKALKFKHLISFGGLLKEIKKDLELDDVEESDLINLDSEDEKEKTTGEVIIAFWNWERKNYIVFEKMEERF